MKQPWWKVALSYVWDIEIDYRSSDYNPDLIVLLSHGRYQLCTSNAIYSYEDKYHNFREILAKHVAYDQLKDNKVLVLGLGLGSVPIIMDKYHPGRWAFTAVEIDEEVCDLAAIYGYPKIISDIDTVITDAHSYVNIVQDSFDIICVDLFVGDNTPNKFRTKDFLLRLQAMTALQGYIIYNTPAFNDDDKVISRVYYDEVFSKTLHGSKLIDAHRNYMLVWQNV